MTNTKKNLLIITGAIVATLYVIAMMKFDILQEYKDLINFIVILTPTLSTLWINQKMKNELVEGLRDLSEEEQEKILAKLTGRRRHSVEEKLKIESRTNDLT